MRIVARWRKTGYLSDADQRRMHCALQNMRMVCNSTFLLDHETDHGLKVDELMTLLEEFLGDPNAKAVVFSQWLGTHELIKRRLLPRGWGHVLFSGSVPGDQRGALMEKFHTDPNCRLFLATDAGGVGLNLQHAAAMVVNMDLPWNSALLEQRIGRVHRMGQSRGVQVVNFVGQASIEEGMLLVLAFKKSLFAGVLDGGEVDVFMQGTHLSKFMESVEQVAGAIGEDEADELVQGPARQPVHQPAHQPAGELAAGGQAQDRQSTGLGPDDPWAAILNAGAALLQGLASSRGAAGAAAAPISIERDSVTGQPGIRLPMPDAAVFSAWPRHWSPG